MDAATLFANLGFPIALAVYLLQKEARSTERMLQVLEKAVAAMERSNKVTEELAGKLKRGDG